MMVEVLRKVEKKVSRSVRERLRKDAMSCLTGLSVANWEGPGCSVALGTSIGASVLVGFEAVEAVGTVCCEVPDVGGLFPIVVATGVVIAIDGRVCCDEGKVEVLTPVSEPGVAKILSKRVVSLGTCKDLGSRPRARRSWLGLCLALARSVAPQIGTRTLTGVGVGSGTGSGVSDCSGVEGEDEVTLGGMLAHLWVLRLRI